MILAQDTLRIRGLVKERANTGGGVQNGDLPVADMWPFEYTSCWVPHHHGSLSYQAAQPPQWFT